MEKTESTGADCAIPKEVNCSGEYKFAFWTIILATFVVLHHSAYEYKKENIQLVILFLFTNQLFSFGFNDFYLDKSSLSAN